MMRSSLKWLLAVATSLALLTPAPRAQAQPAGQPTRIAIAMFGPHPTLQQVVEGFKQEIAAQGINAIYDEGNVNFDRSLAPQLLTRMAAANPALMLTVTTPMTQAARQVLASRNFPIVFAPVTDPVAAKLVPSWEHGDALMTGVSNIPDLDATCDFIKTLLPSATRLGIAYNPGDDSDVAFVNKLEKIVGSHGLQLVKVGIDNANDIAPRLQSLQGRADALFVPASSLLQPAAATIASVTNRIKLPVFNSNTTQVVDHQFLAALSVDWGRIGVNAGRMAADILKGKKPVDLPVSLPSRADHEMKISARRMSDLGLTLPDSLKSCDCVIK
ncbi:ABC transporter substrate-binding protein [Bradyrhizobium sp. AZCC 2230]|uniref:ABC transporter substrate-binding protein n=1 Tax=Bradyrhizobium sp. AZCC 2230 TaxID=3117021 RepID=UPI002FF14D72